MIIQKLNQVKRRKYTAANIQKYMCRDEYAGADIHKGLSLANKLVYIQLLVVL